MAFGIVLTEFITGWTLFQRQEAKLKMDQKLHTWTYISWNIANWSSFFDRRDHCMVSIVRCSNK